MQKVVGGYLTKRIEAELFAPPAPPAEPDPSESGPPAPDDAPDRLAVTDGRGRAVGTAYRLPGVAVYVVSDGHGHRQEELEWCLRDPNGRLFVLRDGGRVSGLVYAPAAKRRRRQAEGLPAGLRADEV